MFTSWANIVGAEFAIWKKITNTEFRFCDNFVKWKFLVLENLMRNVLAKVAKKFHLAKTSYQQFCDKSNIITSRPICNSEVAPKRSVHSPLIAQRSYGRANLTVETLWIHFV